jgi:hypothetical protein
VRRLYFSDDETGRLGMTDGELPDGPFVEEITALEFYKRSSLKLSCGWPEKSHEASKDICPCGCIFPDRVPSHWHDDEALQ